MSYLEKAQAMYKMVGEGKIMDAFEHYYHEDVTMIEATGDKREGKKANREYEQDFVKGIEEMHGGGVHAVTSNEDEKTSMVESWMDVTMGGKRQKMEQVARQKWEGDKIIEERFYYNA